MHGVDPERSSPASAVLNRQTAARLGRAIRNFATSDAGGRAAALAGALLALLLAINALNIVNSFVGRYFMTAVEQRNGAEFVRQAILYVAVFAASTLAAVLHRFTEERLGLLWREWLTRRLVGVYLQGRVYYRLETDGTLANPDQRIADDVRAFTTSTLSLSLIFINGAVTMLSFSGVLWSISRPLFLVALAYAAVGSLCAFLLGRPLVGLNYDQSDREADFRNQLVRLRQDAESVALLRREALLGGRLNRQIGALVGNLKRIIAVNRNLGFFTTGYTYLIQIIPVLIVGPLFMRGAVEFGVISQAVMAFAYVLGAFSLVVNQFPTLSSYAAVLARLSALAEAEETAAAGATGGIAVVEEPSRLAFDGVTLRAPRDGRVLVRDLSLELSPGARLLVTAPQELVLTALQRAVAGMWESGEGRIMRPDLDHTLLLAPSALPPGPLRELLVGTEPTPPIADHRLWEALRLVSVEDAVRRAGGLDGARDWGGVLAADEQLRVELARLLLARPTVAVLGPLVPPLAAEQATRALAALAGHGIAYVVLGDGGLDRGCFDAVLAIAADGSWTHDPTKEVRP